MRDKNATDSAGNPIGNTLYVTKMDGGSRGPGKRNRPIQGGTTTTCCPPKMYSGIRSKDEEACERSFYGETEKCLSNFDLSILTCDGCSCHKNGHAQLVKIHTKHTLVQNITGSTAACESWFTLVDAGVRSLVARVRKEVSDEKAIECRS